MSFFLNPFLRSYILSVFISDHLQKLQLINIFVTLTKKHRCRTISNLPRECLTYFLITLKDIEKRKLPREILKTDVEIVHKNINIKGKARNISLGGLYITTSKSIDIDSCVDVVIYFGKSKRQLSIKIKGIIKRSDGEGIAIKFNNNDLNKKLSKAFIQ